MDTPDTKKAQPASSSSSILSKFEDSPVFNYISNLSPLTPYNLSRSGHSFQLFGFTSPQSLKQVPNNRPNESQIESETNISDVPKDNCSHNGVGNIISGASCTVPPDTLCIEKVGESDSTQELTPGESNESSKMLIELPKSLKYESGSPENSVAHSDAAGKLDCNSAIQGGSQEGGYSLKNEMGVHGIQLEQNKELCNKEKLIYEPSDNLHCRSPAKDNHLDEYDGKSVDSRTLSSVARVLQPPDESADRTQKLESISRLMSRKNQDLEAHFSRPFVGKPNETSLLPASKSRALRADGRVHYSSTQVDNKQMTRSRCLVSQMSGARYRKLISDPADSPPILKPSPSSNAPNFRGETTVRPGGNKFSSQLPGIGLHLNSLAASSRDKIIVKRQNLACRRQLISSPCNTPSFGPLTSDTKAISTPVSPDSTGLGCEGQGDELLVTGNASQNSDFGESRELHHDSPQKKRKRSENGGETDSCKRCNCKRSKCLKLYCVCFAAGLYCVEPCSCQGCFNKPIHEETVLETRRQIESRNPLAFAPKVISISSTPNNGVEMNTTPASARHQRGCNCKKSGCLKKYCECFQGGVGCSVNCRCEGCKNTFGQKEDTCSYDEIFRTNEENENQATPEPSNNLRRPFHLGGTDYSSHLQSCTTLTTEKPAATAFNEDLNVAPENMFEDENTLDTYVKSTSPKSKRVSPPHYDFEPSLPWKSCRKLILRSVPSFPTEKKAPELHGELQ